MKKSIFISGLLFIALFLIILFSSVFPLIFNKSFYTKECNKLGTNCEKTIHVLDYLKNKSTLSKEFNEREKIHMKDVKNLIYTLLIFYIITTVVVAAMIIVTYIYNKKNFLNFLRIYFLYGGIFSLLLLLTPLMLIYLNFDFVFSVFHRLFFRPGTFLFNENDLLIRLFPEQFFVDAGLNIFFNAIIISIAIIVIGVSTKKFK
ncbi:DUF1461 domain-containing protein [Candidatus Woesearchaeota archaeon]|nr:DUF1461 domain-containing protein [Candidatus Woesearchaeota archaeon]